MTTETKYESTLSPGVKKKRSVMQRFVGGVLAFMLTFGGFFGAQTYTAPQADAAMTAAGLAAALETTSKAKDTFCDEGEGLLKCAEKAIRDGAKFVKDATSCLGDGKINPGDCLDEIAEEEEEEKEEPEDEQTRMVPSTMYRMQAAFTAFYGNSLAGVRVSEPEEEEDEDEDKEGEGENSQNNSQEEKEEEPRESFMETWGGIIAQPSTAGAFVGYDDGNMFDGNSVSMWGASQNQSGVSYSHEDIRPKNITDSAGMYEYMVFGSTLHGMGLDSMAGTGTTTLQSSANGAARTALGGTLLVAYIGSGVVDVIFSFALAMINFFNPFRFLVGGAQEHSSSFAAGMPDGFNEKSRLAPLADFITTIYSGAIEMGWYVTVPISIGLFVAGALLFRRTDKMRGFKRLVTRMFFLGLGIPLLGVTFTGAMNSMQGAGTSSAQMNASRVILMNYVDFETWAMDYRLAIPGSAIIEWDIEGGHPTETSQAEARRAAFAINTMVNEKWKDVGPKPGGQNDKPDDMEKAVDGAQQSLDEMFKDPVFLGVFDLLVRYINQETISGAAYASGVQARIGELSGNLDSNGEDTEEESSSTEDGEGIGSPMSWIDNWKTVEKLEMVEKETLEKSPNPLIQTTAGAGPQAGLHNTAESSSNEVKFATTEVSTDGSSGNPLEKLLNGDLGKAGENGGCKIEDISPDAITACNMSPLTLYNYLNTSFDSKQALVDSSEDSVSNSSRGLHRSVNAVGSGALGLVYWFSAFSLLMSFTLIGIFYAIAMMVSCIKRTFQLITAVPFALVGFIAGIAKVIVYSVTMILEVIGTMFMFRVVQELLIAMPAILEAPLVALFSGEGDTGVGLLGAAAGIGANVWAQNRVAASILITLLASSGVLIFTFMAMKMRGAFITALDEAATRVVNKFLDTGVGGGTSGGGSGVRRTLGSAAGLALATRALNGGDDDGGAAGGASGGQDNAAFGGGQGGSGGDGGGFGWSDAAQGAGAAGLFGLGTALGSGVLDGEGAAGLGGDLGEGGGDADVMQTASFDGDGVDASGEYTGGDMSVDADGNMVNGDGSDYAYGENGEPLSVDDIAQTNGNGELVGADGQVLTGENGEPLTTADVSGVDSHGNLLGADGQPITDANGEAVAADTSALGSKHGAGVGGGGREAHSAAQALNDATDANGNMVGADGEMLRDSAGNLIPASSVAAVNGSGELIDGQGNAITGADGEPISVGALGDAGTDAGAGGLDLSGMSDKEIAQQMGDQGGYLNAPVGAGDTPQLAQAGLSTQGSGIEAPAAHGDGQHFDLASAASGGGDAGSNVDRLGAVAAAAGGIATMASSGGGAGAGGGIGTTSDAVSGTAGVGAAGGGASATPGAGPDGGTGAGGNQGGIPLQGGVQPGDAGNSAAGHDAAGIGSNGFTPANAPVMPGGSGHGDSDFGDAAKAAVVAGGLSALRSGGPNYSNSTAAQATGGGNGRNQKQPGAASNAVQAGARSMQRSSMTRGMGTAAVANVAINQPQARNAGPSHGDDRRRGRGDHNERDERRARRRERNRRKMDEQRDRARNRDEERSSLPNNTLGLRPGGGDDGRLN